MKLDLKDKKILSLLDQNARITINKLAKKTRLNKDVVRYRIRNLEKNKIIKGYYTLINVHKLGYLTFRIYFDFIDLTLEKEKELIEFLDKDFKAGQIFKIDGEYQLGIITWENSIYDFEEKLVKLKKKFGKYINKQQVSIFTKLNHYFRKYLHEKKEVKISLEKQEQVKYNKIDLKILKELSKNARISQVELAKKLSIPQRTIAYRIKQLEKKKIILAYRADIDINLLGYENYFIEVYLQNYENIKQIEHLAEINKNCIYTDYLILGADIEIEVEFKNKNELLDFINTLKNKFKNIRKIRYWSTVEYLKLNYLP